MIRTCRSSISRATHKSILLYHLFVHLSTSINIKKTKMRKIIAPTAVGAISVYFVFKITELRCCLGFLCGLFIEPIVALRTVLILEEIVIVGVGIREVVKIYVSE